MDKKYADMDVKIKTTAQMFIRANKLHRDAFSKIAGSFGMHRGQHRMLMFICKRGGNVSQKQIAEAMDVSPAAITVMLNKLQDSGYIVRVSSDKDSRINLISPTEKANELVRASCLQFDNIDRQMLAGFDENSLDMLCKAFVQMQENMNSEAFEE